MGENNTIPVSVDDFQYYTRRDERLHLLEMKIRKAIEEDKFIDANDLLMFFE